MTSTLAARSRPLTGRMVLIYLLSFFAVVITVNAVMARLAVSSFSGVETESVYKAGLAFKNDVAAAQAQEARHWLVEAHLQQIAKGALITVTAHDGNSRELAGLVPEFRLSHPTDRRRDITIEATEVSPGVFQSQPSVEHGQWDLILTFKRAAETVFRSKSRISI
ncbi:FixH family protein [Microvirga puerhi]|uniref:FixH family protein n=1 Tax=Microvirga puerhi TaxID=2876078 RepID=A0ABS7VIJ7_9HYPH|nr:FixH family protein [Microvirga puerhi]MBZ6075356.1 FixH family protein [Microvirga puerhi]